MNTPRLKFFLLFICLIAFSPIFSNAQSSKRIEIELEDNSDHHIVPLGTNGILVLSKGESKKNVSDVNFDLYDTDLNKVNTTSISLDKKDEVLIDYVIDGENVYLLYSKSQISTVFSPMKKFEILNYNSKLRTAKKFMVDLKEYIYFKNIFAHNGVVSLTGSMGLSPSQIQQRSCLYGALSCGCMVLAPFYANNLYKKLRPSLLTIDFNKNKPTLNTHTYLKEKEKSEFLSASLNDSTGAISMISKTIISKKENKHTMHVFNNGKFGKEINIKFPNGKEIIEARINTFEDREVYAATYSSKVTKMMTMAVSSGIAVGSIKGGVSQFNTLIPYSKFKNFKFATSKVEERMIKKSAKKGIEETEIEMMVKFHPAIEQENEMVFCGEVYYPTYRYVTTTSVDAQGRTSTSTQRVFDGFRYQGAVVFAVSNTGEFLWENGTNVDDYNRYFSNKAYRYKFIEQNDGGVKVLYNDGKTLFTATIYDGNTITMGAKIPLYNEKKTEDKKASTKVKANNTTENASSISKNGIEYWYENYFVSFGEQSITSKKEKTLLGIGKSKKQIYYIDKVNVE